MQSQINNTARLLPFAFGDQLIRTTQQDDQPWFVIADVCTALELNNPRMVAERLDPNDVSTTDAIDRLSRLQVMNPCNQSGLYQLIFQSRKATALVAAITRHIHLTQELQRDWSTPRTAHAV